MNNHNYTLPIILLTSVFFWRLTYTMTGVLNKHSRETLGMHKMGRKKGFMAVRSCHSYGQGCAEQVRFVVYCSNILIAGSSFEWI